MIFFALGAVLYALVPFGGPPGQLPLFVVIFCVILTMYGGGFATIPAYLADIFGTQFVGAIHGRLLTAWSAAGLLGPVLVNYIREFQLDRGVPRGAGVQRDHVRPGGAAGASGFFCNLAVRPVEPRYLPADERVRLGAAAHGGKGMRND